MAISLDLNKSAQSLTLSLAKAGVNTPPSAEVAFDLDVSGSFHDEHCDGLTQDLLMRLVPWGMVFDPDQKLDVFTFSSSPESAHYAGEITPVTADGFIKRSIIQKVPGYGCGTDYSFVLAKSLEHFGWANGSPAAPPKRSFFGFGSSKAAAPAAPLAKKRSIVIFVTDGDNTDKRETEQVLAESEARGDGVYFLFIGISNGGGSFPFLKKIGDRFSNTGLVVINDLKRFNAQSDEELNGQLIGGELVTWLKQ